MNKPTDSGSYLIPGVSFAICVVIIVISIILSALGLTA